MLILTVIMIVMIIMIIMMMMMNMMMMNMMRKEQYGGNSKARIAVNQPFKGKTCLMDHPPFSQRV